MKNTLRLITGLLAVAVMFASPVAFAAMPLSAKQVESFLGSMKSVDSLTDEMKAAGKQEALQAEMDKRAGVTFTPYVNSVTILKEKYGPEYGKLGDIVKKHGFSSQEEWANVGDAVMLSYMALKAEKEPGFEKAATELTPEMMAQIPPETRAQVEKTMKMMNAIKAAPAEHKQVVTPFIADIDKWIGEQQAAQQ